VTNCIRVAGRAASLNYEVQQADSNYSVRRGAVVGCLRQRQGRRNYWSQNGDAIRALDFACVRQQPVRRTSTGRTLPRPSAFPGHRTVNGACRRGASSYRRGVARSCSDLFDRGETRGCPPCVNIPLRHHSRRRRLRRRYSLRHRRRTRHDRRCSKRRWRPPFRAAQTLRRLLARRRRR
jgi:hypothetical protein